MMLRSLVEEPAENWTAVVMLGALENCTFTIVDNMLVSGASLCALLETDSDTDSNTDTCTVSD